MNKLITTVKPNGMEQTYVIRQMAHDKQYKIGGKLFGQKIVRIGDQK